MPKQVLDVGQCDMDHGTISQLIEGQFDAKVTRVYSAPEALMALREQPFDLVLVNRIMDRDHSEGIDLICEVKSDTALSSVPVMLITNFPEHAQQAVDAGAEPGFGKATIEAEQTRQRLAKILGAG